jgi:hypothetical protein
MFNFKLDKVEYNVRFMHANENGAEMEEYRSKRPEVPFKRFTNCYITNMETGAITLGQAFCSKKDNFSRFEGRKKSYQRAIQKLTQNKVHRIYLYDVYNTATDSWAFILPVDLTQ